MSFDFCGKNDVLDGVYGSLWVFSALSNKLMVDARLEYVESNPFK